MEETGITQLPRRTFPLRKNKSPTRFYHRPVIGDQTYNTWAFEDTQDQVCVALWEPKALCILVNLLLSSLPDPEIPKSSSHGYLNNGGDISDLKSTELTLILAQIADWNPLSYSFLSSPHPTLSHSLFLAYWRLIQHSLHSHSCTVDTYSLLLNTSPTWCYEALSLCEYKRWM